MIFILGLDDYLIIQGQRFNQVHSLSFIQKGTLSFTMSVWYRKRSLFEQMPHLLRRLSLTLFLAKTKYVRVNRKFAKAMYILVERQTETLLEIRSIRLRITMNILFDRSILLAPSFYPLLPRSLMPPPHTR